MDKVFLRITATTGVLTAGVTLAAFAWELYVDGDVAQARDAAFTVLVISELMRSFGARSNTRTIRDIGVLSNLRLLLVVLASFVIQIAIHHVVPLQSLFSIEPVTMVQCLAWTALGCVPLVVLEFMKVIRISTTERGAHA
jgi:Ca2+-transporting ATPase